MKHFTFEELIVTHSELPNIPNQEQTDSLIAVVENVLDPARDLLDSPITINSGFRSVAVNDAVGGVKDSQHLKGEAADITCNDNEKLFALIRDNLPFDQLINEHNLEWIHVSFSRIHNRKQIVIIK